MEAVKILDVNARAIAKYLEEVEVLEEESYPWVRAVVDPSTSHILLTSGSFAKQRTAYAAYIGDKMVGYAINYDPEANLDLLHVHPDYRGRGIAQELICVAGSRTVSVDPANKEAIALYVKLGLEIDYDEV